MKKSIKRLFSFALAAALLAFPMTALAASITISGPVIHDVAGNGIGPGGSGDMSALATPIGNSVTINGATISNSFSVYGGYADAISGTSPDAANNRVVFNNGNVEDVKIYGGRAVIGSGDATDNSVTISGGSVTISSGSTGGGIYGGYSHSGDATGNSVTITGGLVDCQIYGGSVRDSKNATGNSVTITGGTIGSSNIYCATTSANGTGNISDNTLTISGSPVFTGDPWLIGGDPGSGNSTGNTLNLHSVISNDVHAVMHFQNINFYLPANIAAGGTMLTVDVFPAGPVDLSAVTIGIPGAAASLRVGDTITLIDKVSNVPTNNNAFITASGYIFELSVSNGALIATVTAVDPPAIATQPANQAVTAPAAATFSVTATGAALTYQWQVDKNDGLGFANVTDGTGGTTAAYTTAATTTAMNGWKYRVVVSGAAAPPVTSNAATLAVALSVTAPANASAVVGQAASFSVTASGGTAPYTYQWQVDKNDGLGFANVTGGAGGTTAAYTTAATTTAMNGWKYQCVVTDNAAASVTSGAATLTVTAQPSDSGFNFYDTLRRTLTDGGTGISVAGELGRFARLAVGKQTLHPAGSCEGCDGIRAQIAAGNVLWVGDISITGGYAGRLSVNIPVESQYEGRTASILHCSHGRLETAAGRVAGGAVSGEFTGFSPYAVVLGGQYVAVPENMVVDPPKTGQGGVWGYALALLALLGLAARRKWTMAN